MISWRPGTTLDCMKPIKINRYYVLYLMLAVMVVFLDQLSKHWILHNMEFQQSLPVLPVFAIVHARNYGAAFGFLNDAGGWQTVFFSLIALGVSGVLLLWLKRIAAIERQLSLALALVLGGAIGNLIDRLQFSYVVDFLLVHYNGWQFPAFNIADSAITIGAILLLMDSFGWKLMPDRSPQN